jgi:hypothetical protein
MPQPIAPEEAMAAYKTIILTLLQEQYPSLHEQLRRQRLLLQAVNDYAAALRRVHLRWMDELRRANPDLDPLRISSEALEMALHDLQEALPCESPPTGEADETFSLDVAMASLPRATPPA